MIGHVIVNCNAVSHGHVNCKAVSHGHVNCKAVSWSVTDTWPHSTSLGGKKVCVGGGGGGDTVYAGNNSLAFCSVFVFSQHCHFPEASEHTGACQ